MVGKDYIGRTGPRAHTALLDLRQSRRRLFEKFRGDPLAPYRAGVHHSQKISRQIDRWQVG